MPLSIAHSGLRPVIAIIGNRNAGKSSLLNSITQQSLSIVSDIPGTTTDAVAKAYEMIPAGPVTIYDTAGLDDTGELGALRIQTSKKIINRADIILYVVGKDDSLIETENKLKQLKTTHPKLITVFNYADYFSTTDPRDSLIKKYKGIRISALTGQGIEELRKCIITHLLSSKKEPQLLSGLINSRDTLILITPMDIAAPKGRLIMPQTQTIREALDLNAIVLIIKTEELEPTLSILNISPKLIVTDSQAIKEVAAIVPSDIPLTTFSMLFAHAKGNFSQLLAGVRHINKLKDGSKILIAEGCAHHITCNDIGRVKIPNLLKKYTKKQLDIDFISGQDFPEDITSYDLIIHCGGCILNQQEMQRRLKQAYQQNINITNYGMVISFIQGVLERTATPFNNLSINQEK
ncbi:MAG: [Alphaproteobacteria bacterium]|nr:[FeFe] hydrogenase H-cluster maturation GTPase HydF [Alphaproteobacteria bacterium]